MADFGLSEFTSVLSMVGTVGKVFSGIAGAITGSNQANATAKAINTETNLQVQAEAKKNRAIIGRNRAVAGAAGVDPFSGTPLETELSNAFTAGMNQAQIKYTGKMEAWQAKQKASQAMNQIPGIVFGGLGDATTWAKGTDRGLGVLTDWYYGTKKQGLLQASSYPGF